MWSISPTSSFVSEEYTNREMESLLTFLAIGATGSGITWTCEEEIDVETGDGAEEVPGRWGAKFLDLDLDLDLELESEPEPEPDPELDSEEDSEEEPVYELEVSETLTSKS